MKSLSKILKSPYFKLIYYSLPFFAFFILLFFGEGLFWQFDQTELEKQKFAFEREKETSNLRNNIDNNVNLIIELSNEIYKKELEGKISNGELDLFKTRYDLLRDNLGHYQSSLQKLTSQRFKFNIPNPLKKYFINEYMVPSKPTNITISRQERSLFNYIIQTNLLTFISLLIFIVFITYFLTKIHVQRKCHKNKK